MMTQRLGLISLIGVGMLTSAPIAHAGGFLLNDHGAKATGRVDAVSATVTDGSAIFYNPGGVGAAEGTHIYLGASMIQPSATFTPEGASEGIDSETGTAVTPNAYFHTQVHPMVRVGVGFYTPFGSSLKWGENSPGRDVVRNISLKTFYISPVVGLNLDRFVPGLSLGGGVDFVPATVSIERDIFFDTTVGTAELGGNAFGVGGRVGLQYRPTAAPGLSMGISYRTRVKLQFTGQADFDVAAPFRSTLPPDGDISADLTLPDFWQGGIAYKFNNFELEADVQWVGWKSVESLDITLPDDSVTVDRRDYHSVYTFRFGAEYSLPKIGLDIRAGYAYDPTPIPTTTLSVSLPDVDRHVVSIGGSYRLPKGYVDVGLLAVLPGNRDTSAVDYQPQLKGNYEISALVFALSYGITLGADPAPKVVPATALAKK